MYEILLRNGVTDIFCTGTGYCLFRPDLYHLLSYSGLIVSLVGFVGNEWTKPPKTDKWHLDSGTIVAGIFDPVGVSPIGIAANTLTTVSVQWPGTKSDYSDSGLQCAIVDFDSGCTFYVVAMTKDKTRLMITHVLYTPTQLDPVELGKQVQVVKSVEDVGQVLEEYALSVSSEPLEQIVHAAKCLTGLAVAPVKRGLSEVELNARQKRIEKLRLKRLLEELMLGPYPTPQAIMLASATLNKMLEVKEKPQPLPFEQIKQEKEEKDTSNESLTYEQRRALMLEKRKRQKQEENK